MEICIYKIKIENGNTKKTATLYVDGIDNILNSEPFLAKIKDAKTGRTTTIKEQMLRQLGEENKGIEIDQ